jgi:hypothetical protein
MLFQLLNRARLMMTLRPGPRFGFPVTDEYRATVRKTLNDEILPKHLSFLERKLTESTTGGAVQVE